MKKTIILIVKCSGLVGFNIGFCNRIYKIQIKKSSSFSEAYSIGLLNKYFGSYKINPIERGKICCLASVDFARLYSILSNKGIYAANSASIIISILFDAWKYLRVFLWNDGL